MKDPETGLKKYSAGNEADGRVVGFCRVERRPIYASDVVLVTDEPAKTYKPAQEER
jgi:hypothetical protein